MEQDQSQERTERATPKRLRDAKRKGQVARSRELNTAMLLTVTALVLYGLGAEVGQGLVRLMERSLDLGPADLADPAAMLHRMRAVTFDLLILGAPLLLAALGTALIAPILLGGWTLSGELLIPKLERLSPIKGFARIFSLTGLVELVKAIVKLALITGVGGVVLWSHRSEILAPPDASVARDMLDAFRLFALVLLTLSAATFLVAAMDVPYQLWDHGRKLRMTRQEVRDELKEHEGRPEVKSRIRQLQRDLSRRRMMDEVPKADLVVTNPTHYAVALRYEPLKCGAPRVVAKGADLLAGQIRTLARAKGVPVIEAPPLARALYRGVKLDQEIPGSLYMAVAQLLAYVYQLRTARDSGTREPEPPRDLPVSADLSERGV
ncbi:MAG: flagellar biosynthesis protein FlhB [Chromatiaceae bacterium]|jgi:flagellar biosynthetic protein FlhB